LPAAATNNPSKACIAFLNKVSLAAPVPPKLALIILAPFRRAKSIASIMRSVVVVNQLKLLNHIILA
jgi:hypothetical protein